MTNKIALRSVEEFMADYTPIYQPLYPLILGGKSASYSEEVGTIDFKRVDTVGDIRAKHITPKDTEIRQIAVNEAKKTFKKYFLANQFTISNFQDQQGLEDVVAQVLDEHQKQMDELVLFGEGTSSGDVINNGLFYSADANYTLENSATVAAASDNNLIDLHSKIIASAVKADQVSGRKLLLFYGTNAIARFNSLYVSQPVPFKRVLGDVLGANYSVAQLPSGLSVSGDGWMIVNLDQIKTHYTAMPALKAQGVNEEKMYAWFNFLMGSAMVEVLAKNAVIRQPVTFA